MVSFLTLYNLPDIIAGARCDNAVSFLTLYNLPDIITGARCDKAVSFLTLYNLPDIIAGTRCDKAVSSQPSIISQISSRERGVIKRAHS